MSVIGGEECHDLVISNVIVSDLRAINYLEFYVFGSKFLLR